MSDVDDGGHLADPPVSGSAGGRSESSAGRAGRLRPDPFSGPWPMRPGERLSSAEDRQLGLYEPLEDSQLELFSTECILAVQARITL